MTGSAADAAPAALTPLPAAGAERAAWLLLDQLSICFALLITGVGSLIHIFAVGYMEHDQDRRRFFGYMNLCVTAMLVLVLADNYVLLYAGWEGVGLASYLLIGFWFGKPVAAWKPRTTCRGAPRKLPGKCKPAQ